MPHTILTPAELRKFADEHLRYEIEMLLGVSHANLGTDQFLMNLRVESFGIHLRNMIDFFYYAHPQADDVVAAHFFSQATVAASPIPQITQTLDRARTRVNKELGHLTTQRIHGYSEEKVWHFADLAAEIVALLKIFEANVDANAVSDDLRHFIRSL